MMQQEKVPKNEKPRIKVGASTQGMGHIGNSKKDNTPAAGKARYEQGLELYRAGAVSIGDDGYFRVLGFRVDVEKVTCDCPEYQKYKQPCLHFYAATAYQKHGKPEMTTDAPNTQIQARGRDFVSPRVNLRVKALSLAVEVLQTYNKPITSKNLFKVAAELESWALGGE